MAPRWQVACRATSVIGTRFLRSSTSEASCAMSMSQIAADEGEPSAAATSPSEEPVLSSRCCTDTGGRGRSKDSGHGLSCHQAPHDRRCRRSRDGHGARPGGAARSLRDGDGRGARPAVRGARRWARRLQTRWRLPAPGCTSTRRCADARRGATTAAIIRVKQARVVHGVGRGCRHRRGGRPARRAGRVDVVRAVRAQQ